ncbi:GAF domain-containing sensor histidine kinase [Geothrix sp. 21YS21S-2]|uniref:GAF domain-containing sensor histidine kinase n=1 Tax=Geothrix sp. 21YS21S-2 TaxID=3068893 RepID=UPI0027B95059|nr:GAF domain-containing sensor histidine kinase [Geothrix sp. 21YS21S-2]
MAEVHPILHFLAPTGAGAVRAFDAQEQEVLDHVNREIAGESSLDDILDFLFQGIRELYPCDRIGLAFIEDEGRRIVAHRSRANYEPILLKEGYAEDLAGSSLRRVLDSNCARVIYDLPRYLADHPRSGSTRILVKEGVRSSLTCPLTVKDRAIGVIFLSSRETRAYTPYHVQLWMALAERLSQAVEKTWRIEQLTAANQAYTEVLAFVSHELKNPIASMITDARVLADGYLGPLEARQTQKLERLISKGSYLLDLIGEYLDLARMEGGNLALHPIAAAFEAEVVEPSMELALGQAKAKGMTLERRLPPDLPPVQCDPGLLRIVLANLLGNAVKYGREGGAVRLTVESGPAGLKVAVWNEGPGFRAEDRPKLFRKFSRLQSPELRAQKGTGVGLYTAWRIVHLHGGRMDAVSQAGAWAEFSFEVPQPLPEVGDKGMGNP